MTPEGPPRDFVADKHRFPTYTRAEHGLDSAVHLIGVPAAMVAVVWLLAGVRGAASTRLIASLAVYAVGLIGMLGSSAAYHLTRPGPAKDLLRRADHAMIYVMIAGSYTPLGLNVLEAPGGVLLCAAIWALAAVGIALKLAFPRRFERLSLALYLGMGWAVVSMIGPLIRDLPRLSLELLLAGGVVYSLGAVIYTRHNLKFHTVAWHALVLVAAGLHLAALHVAFVAG
jgi:hemolysin III